MDFLIWPSVYLIKIKFSQLYIADIMALHEILGYRRQRGQKDNRIPFATTPQVIRVFLANC